ncbi:flagellar assembly protein FliW [Pengzhenrongella sicca]|uniref:Flagellar assembly protein FliW n=1 Tax=Pengzhenrongella sicca TaxID=2819238 RepID=A0A8A4ZJS7_9MICO|nr:flagellar assembly protein FliW [Pengzhenrongella sicca]QTE29848.1 flagellar assembly protein FliW [Pengzhenrongella sicca]
MTATRTLVRPVTALPGLPGHLEYSLDGLDDDGTLFALRSASDPTVRLFVVRPEVFFADYLPRVGASTREALGLGDDDEALLLVVVHPGDDDRPATANLLAPVVINPATGAASQVVLSDGDWPLRARLG